MARRISCEQISPLLSAYLDGELSRAERESVEWHLRECEACRSELRELEQAKRFTLQLGEVQPPLSLRERIMARVEKERECESVRPLLGAYLDEEIPAEERERVELHLALCSDCQEELESARKVRQVLQTLPEVEPPLYLRARIYASIEKKPLFVRRFALGFATLAAAASLVFFALPIHRTTPSPTAPIIAQRTVPSLPSHAQSLPAKPMRVAVKPAEKASVPSQVKPTRTVIPTITSQQKEQTPAIATQPAISEKPQIPLNVNRPVVQPQLSEQPSPSAVREETKIAEAASTPAPKEVAPAPSSPDTTTKVAVKPEPSLSDVLKNITRSVDKPSLPSRLTEKLDKSIVIGVAKVEF